MNSDTKFKIYPSLTTSKEDLKTLRIHSETTRDLTSVFSKVEALHATPLRHPNEIIPVRIFYSYRDRQINLFKIRPSLTTSKDGQIKLNIHIDTTRI
jgi:hypothetical protein